ncbi:hypothetical protein Q4543_21960 [Salipiger sp. 1_MG-2023]|nr:hypothetical protein [Salipiger sp. 1_MG-2023]MDO6588168.1 hypothetical protein [Salipiger sp. 1_MG-2023]
MLPTHGGTLGPAALGAQGKRLGPPKLAKTGGLRIDAEQLCQNIHYPAAQKLPDRTRPVHW